MIRRWVLLAVLVGGAHVRAAAEIHWFQGSLEDAQRQATLAHKPLMLLFYKPGCGPCQMHDSTLMAPEVAHDAAHFICVRIDVDAPGGKERQKHMRALGTPITVFFDWKGQEVDRVSGTKAAPDFLAEMKRIRSGRGTLPDLMSRASQHADDAEFNLTLGSKLSDRGDVRARTYLNRVLALDSTNAAGKAHQALYALALLAMSLEEHSTCIEPLERLLEKFPRSGSAPDAYRVLARCYTLQGDTLHALATFERGVAAAPEQPESWNLLAWNCAKWKLRLDRGLEAARKAVDLSGGEAPYLDTLAEVHFARGEFAEAVAIERKALEKMPNEESLRAQLAKFEAAAGAGASTK